VDPISARRVARWDLDVMGTSLCSALMVHATKAADLYARVESVVESLGLVVRVIIFGGGAVRISMVTTVVRIRCMTRNIEINCNYVTFKGNNLPPHFW
jgi:hypothetical protein